MMRWKAGFTAFVLLALSVAGCKQQVFLSDKTFNDATMGLVRDIENNTGVGVEPVSDTTSRPPDVNDPERTPYLLSLQEAIAMALENGLVSSRAGFVTSSLGDIDDTLLSFTGTSLNGQTERIRVLAMNPAISGSQIESALSRFDAQWITSMNWTNRDQLQQGLTSFQNGQSANFQSSVVKAFSSGAVANMSFLTDYQLLSNPPLAGGFAVFNPFYTARMQFGIEQPLWRDFGTEINQIARSPQGITGQTMPGFAAQKFNSQFAQASGSTEGILIARLRFDQQRAEFDRNVQIMLLNVEAAYWNLYKSYGKLYAFEEVMRLAQQAWAVMYERFRLGQTEASPEKYYPVRAQFEEFRGNRLEALGEVLDRERTLRGVLGLPVEDGRRLVPITPPNLATFSPNWEAAVNEALNNRPELILARENLRFHQLNLIGSRNSLKPDLRLFGNYSPAGFGTRIDGNGTLVDGTGTTRTNNAFRGLTEENFHDWNAGLLFHMPMGFRLENANVRKARLELAQSFYVLRDQEERAQRYLTRQYQKLPEWYRRIELARAERLAYKQAIQTYLRKIEVDKTTQGDLAQLDAQRRYALALIKEYDAIAEYNITMARFELAKGTIMQHDNVTIAEGDLPPEAQVRAVEHERRRTAAIQLRERPDAMMMPAMVVGDAPPGFATDGAAPPEGIPAPKNKNGDTSIKLPRPPNGTPTSLPGPRRSEPPVSRGNPTAPPQISRVSSDTKAPSTGFAGNR